MLQRAISNRAWPDVFDVAARLVARGDEGEPRGIHAVWASVAAGRQGRLFDAVFYARHATAVVAVGTDLDASALCNLAYFCVPYGAPESALVAGNTYLSRIDLYSPKSRELAPRVLQHLGAARELLGQWPEAARLYREAAWTASEPAIRAVALIDYAYAELVQGTDRLDTAEAALNDVQLSDLDARGLFALKAVRAHILHHRGDLDGSDNLSSEAIHAAEAVEEPLTKERSQLKLLHARNAAARYRQTGVVEERTRALAEGLEAALIFQQQGLVSLYHEAREFLQGILNEV